MGTPRTSGAVSATAGTPTPVYTGAVIAASTFSITNGVARIVLASAPPTIGYNGPNGYPIVNGTTGSVLDIQGKYPAANGQQITLWGFTTATYFNGKTVSVRSLDPSTNSFTFFFTHANVGSTADAGNTAPIPVEQYRVVRLECSQSNGTDLVYVGDGNVSSSRYVAALSLSGQIAVEIASDNIRADRVFIDATTTGDSVQVSFIY